MTSRRRTVTVAALALAAAVTTVAVAVATTRASDGGQRARPPVSVADPAGRRELLGDLALRLIPTTSGGFVVSTPAEQADLPTWVLAAALDTRSSGAVRDRALQAVARRLRPPVDEASETIDSGAADPGGDGTGPPSDEEALRAAVAAAQALQAVDGPLTDEQEGLADQILRRTRAELRAGSGGWLAPLLQLAVGPSRAAEGAGTMVSSYAGDPTCDRLTGASATAPQPQRELTVLIVALRARGETCPTAGALLDRLLRDPAWATPIAGYELLELARLTPVLTRGIRERLEQAIASWLDSGDGSVVDPASVLIAELARHDLGLQIEVPDAVQRHIAGQARLRGALADRSSAPPTAYDVVILRQLVAEGLVPRSDLAASVQAAEPLGASGDEARVDDVLLRGELPSCAQAAVSPRRGPKVTIPSLMGEEVRRVVRAACDGRLDVAALVADARDRSIPDLESPRVLAVVLAACHLRKDSVDAAAAGPLERGGPFADDSFHLMGAAAGLDPVGTCAAELGG